ncbi:uncharacterized protein LOC113385425 [Ctenocephalides felis]|uniref:uncharacterized protein LOC113385425 n=1 Tax=Ctenocephalides felis TaxID=7515 RepID=UPI000E6E4F5F|nr:uncharacterized protein LOC113385425 [Ctenocephalides felis]
MELLENGFDNSDHIARLLFEPPVRPISSFSIISISSNEENDPKCLSSNLVKKKKKQKKKTKAQSSEEAKESNITKNQTNKKKHKSSKKERKRNKSVANSQNLICNTIKADPEDSEEICQNKKEQQDCNTTDVLQATPEEKYIVSIDKITNILSSISYLKKDKIKYVEFGSFPQLLSVLIPNSFDYCWSETADKFASLCNLEIRYSMMTYYKII